MTAIKNATTFWDNPYLFVMLGPQCNMACRHCSQIPYKKAEQIKDEISDDTMQLIDSYIRYYQNRTGEFKNALIAFWGGEALLHWDTIKTIVKHFTEKYNMWHTDGKVMFAISSNGLLVTDEVVDFCNKYNVQFNLSFDTPYPFAVRGYISEEQVYKTMKMKNLCVLGSLNAINCDLYAALCCMRAKFNTVYRLFFNFQLLYTSELPQDILAFDFAKVRKGLKMCRIAIQLGDKFFGESVWPLLRNMKYPELRVFTLDKYNLRHCVPGARYLTITLDGKVVRCHNDARIVLGDMNESLDDLFAKGLTICQKMQGKLQTEKCRTCEHNDLCPGGCMMGMRNKDGTYRACDLYTKPIFTILKEEMLQLSKPLTEEDKLWYYENKPAYDKLAEDYKNGVYYENRSV